MENLEKYDFVFTAYQGKLFAQEQNIEYAIVYPNYDEKEEYADRMLERGNPEVFVAKILNNWDNMIKGCEDDNNKNLVLKIKLGKKEYLLDKLPELEDYIDSEKENFRAL